MVFGVIFTAFMTLCEQEIQIDDNYTSLKADQN